MAGIGIISNPNSRRNRRYPDQMRRLAYVLGEGDVGATTNSLEDVSEVARRFRDTDIDILALNGGDGTNHVTLTRFIEVYGDKPLPMIALLRGGTMNTVSNAIGIRGRPNALLVNIVEKYHLGHPFEISSRDLLYIDDGEKRSYGFIFGTGVISNFLSIYYETGAPSPSMAARILARGIGSVFINGPTIRRILRPSRGKIWVDDELWQEGEFGALTASTIDQIGLGFRPYYRCEAKPGAFHAIAFKTTPFGLAKLLPGIRFGKPLPYDQAPDVVTARMRFESEEPMEYTVDGDIHSGGKCLDVGVGPRLRIIVK
ncbi:MAG: diacylglycerol kinase [Myxococcales bacterium]|nr:diacylglycerol kinase [Myxococcales bacterium]